MYRTTIGRRASAILLGLLVGVTAPAHSETILYTESFTASGSLGGASFTDQPVTLTAYGDTSTLFQTPAVAFVDSDASFVAIAGLATASFTDTLDVFVVYNPRDGGIFGFTDFNSPNGGDILDVQASPFLTYDLVSPIGPIVGSFADFSSLNNPSATSAGDLILTAVGNDVIVTASAVPEPSSVTLIAVAGVVGLIVVGVRRKRSERFTIVRPVTMWLGTRGASR